MTFRIRKYEPGDAAAISMLFFEAVRKLGPRAYSLEQVAAWAPQPADPGLFHRVASDGRLTLVAVDLGGDTIAYGDLEADGHLDHLYCHPESAGRGVGGALVEALLTHAAASGLERVFTEASEIARPVFSRKGFRLLHRRDFAVRGVSIHNYRMEWTNPSAAKADRDGAA